MTKLCDIVFSLKSSYEMRISDWSSNLCSSVLPGLSRSQLPRTGAGVAFRPAPAPDAYAPRVRADAELDSRAAAGDRDAFAALYDRYATPVHDLLRRMLRDDHEASDALQDTFFTAGERLHQLRDPSRFRPWVYAIARRRAYLVTSRQRRFETLEDDDVISAEPDYSEGLAAAHLRPPPHGPAGGLRPDKRRVG